MTDDLDVQLRDAFAAQAERAPAAGDLAGAARRRAGTQRRRRVFEVAGVAAVVLVLTVGAAVWVGSSGEPGSDVAAGPSPSTAPRGGADGVLAFRGVEVPVPQAWLDPANRPCGVPVADAAYVVRGGESVPACIQVPEHPEQLTEVVLQPWILPVAYPEAPAAGTNLLTDGRTQVVGRVGSSDVRLIVIAPDRERAVQLWSSAEVTQANANVDGPGFDCRGLTIQLVGSGGQSIAVDPKSTSVLAIATGDLLSLDARGSCAATAFVVSSDPAVLGDTADPDTLRALAPGTAEVAVQVDICGAIPVGCTMQFRSGPPWGKVAVTVGR